MHEGLIKILSIFGNLIPGSFVYILSLGTPSLMI